MGCFLSSTKRTIPNPNIKLQTTITTHRSPPSTLPFLEEEEEVKEILSETPIINSSITHSTNEKNNTLERRFSPEKKQCHNIHDSHVCKIARIFNPRDLSGSLRFGSDPKELSQSLRVGSDPKEPRKELNRSIQAGSDPKETSKELSRHIRVGSGQKEMKEELSRSIRVGSDPKEKIKDIRHRSPAKYRNTSPARKSDHLHGSGQIRNTSPARKTDHISGSGHTRNNSPSRVGSGKNTGGLSRKDNGESSCRRSRSPVMCADSNNGGTRNSISRSVSTRKSGKSPGRVRSELGDRRRSPAEAGNGSRSNRENRETNNYKRSLTGGINESIENPLVSLECFIFI